MTKRLIASLDLLRSNTAVRQTSNDRLPLKIRPPCLQTPANTVSDNPNYSLRSTRFARIRPYAKLQTTVYPSKSTPIPPRLRLNPFQTIPNKLLGGPKQNVVSEHFQTNLIFHGLHSSETPQKQSGMLRNLPEACCRSSPIHT